MHVTDPTSREIIYFGSHSTLPLESRIRPLKNIAASSLRKHSSCEFKSAAITVKETAHLSHQFIEDCFLLMIILENVPVQLYCEKGQKLVYIIRRTLTCQNSIFLKEDIYVDLRT